MNKCFDQSVVWVTGSSRGIGAAVAKAFAARGAQVILHYVSQKQQAEEVAAVICRANPTAFQPMIVSADVASEEAIVAAASRIKNQFGKLDVLINNAGIAIPGLLPRFRIEDMDRIWATNMRSAMLLCKHAFGLLSRASLGSIIQMSSILGLTGGVGQSVYAASKAGLIALTQSLAREYGSRGIRVNAVAPGWIETDMTAGVDPKIKSHCITRIPLRRIGTPEDVAACCCFLASSDASYITGQCLVVDGGMSLLQAP